MVNKVELVNKMLPLIDEVYKTSAKSAILEAPKEFVRESANAKSVEIAKLALVGLGNYDKQTGFPAGDISLTWETHEFTNDRGRRFQLDRMDDIEAMSLVAARLVGNFMREHVIPEVDAYRFAKIASYTGVTSVAANLTDSTVKKAVSTAITTLEEREIDTNSLVIFTTPTTAEILSENIARSVPNGEKSYDNRVYAFNGVPIVKVPQTRLYTSITLDPGTASNKGGYAKTEASGSGENAVAAGKDINFIVMDKAAAFNVTKLNIGKVFTPDENQKLDAWQFDFRLYHDTFVLDNKAKGIYVHTKA